MSKPTEISRRRVVAGAAWAAPAIVVASAAPAFAASGPPSVTTLVSADRSETTLEVGVRFVNTNTASTGMTTAEVTFTPTPLVGGSVADEVPVIDQMQSSSGWVPGPVSGTAQRRNVSFTRAAGIDGAPSATGTAETLLTFSVTVVPTLSLASSGDIDVFLVPGEGGTQPNGTGAWT